jgi:hypothetical protein
MLSSCLTLKETAPERPHSESRDPDRKTEEQPPIAYFYEIRSADDTVLKHDGGFPTQNAAKNAGREDAKKMKNSRPPDRPDVERILVGQKHRKTHAVVSGYPLRQQLAPRVFCVCDLPRESRKEICWAKPANTLRTKVQTNSIVRHVYWMVFLKVIVGS